MARKPKRLPRDERDAVVESVSIDTAVADQHHGFDYEATVRALERNRLSLAAIGRACGVDKETVRRWRDEGSTPRHDNGEALYLLYFNTFNSPKDRAAWDTYRLLAPEIKRPPTKPYAGEK